MLINKKFSYPKLNRVTLETERYYETSDGERLSSVTTILSKTSDKEFLKEWRERIGNDEADRQIKYASSLGTIFHEHLENHIQDIPRPNGTSIIYKQAEKMSDQVIKRGLAFLDEVWGIEEILYYPSLYAGTCDLIGVYKGNPSIIDYKTTKKPKKEEQVENYKLQLCAYAMAHNFLFGTNITQGVILMCSRDNQFQEFIIDTNEYMDRWTDTLEKFYDKK